MPSYDVFVSYGERDEASVEAIALRLQAETSIRVFFSRWHLVPGESSVVGLERALEDSDVLAVFFGPGGVQGWQQQERDLVLELIAGAHRRHQRAIPVLLPGADVEMISGFMRARTMVDLSKEDGFARLIAGIEGRSPGPPTKSGGQIGGAQLVEAGRPAPPEQRIEVTDRQLVDELGDVICDPELARTVAIRAGLSRRRIPAFRIPGLFWEQVAEDARNGANVGGMYALARAAAQAYPTNRVFKAYRRSD